MRDALDDGAGERELVIAWVFPGQGAQVVGMGREMAQAFPSAHDVFMRANEALGFDLARVCWDGPDDALRQTEVTQPALLTTSTALFTVLREAGHAPSLAAGLSLGEYTALVCTGAMDFEPAVRVVRSRGAFMTSAAAGRPTAMAAILGLDADAVRAVCVAASHAGVVEPSNFNSPGQVVIAGDEAAVREGMAQAKTAGARRAVLLAVSAPFHTSLMAPAAARLAEALAAVAITAPAVPVVSNVTAQPVAAPDEIRRLLVAQVASPVRWDDSVRTMAAAGTETFVEIGPGTTLSGLIRQTLDGVRTLHVEDPKSLDETLQALQ
ncbi:MAG TPA: ACP S-malonyltransferase [bacterium]|nr:ACP S-malonyltransferase [bacterium]